MKGNKQTFLILFAISISFITNSYSQESIVVTGGDAAGAGGKASYSIGQISYTSLPGSNGYVTQGVQQAYEIAALGKDEFTEINLVMNAYPNPTVDVLNLVVSDNKSDNLSCSLFDSSGKLVSKNLKITATETSVSMQELNQGIYFLAVTNGNKTIKTFKIIKK
ncbi:putative secreted protein (Por secretion system target) [Flavobacterium sp. 270]|uniref:T9SS type A sorting domain-containing protein n=1 Tax=Flavobacterium sp. 270 TaxID=2512114 RepID=UPI0010668525|nr:T9SS type A sorting domain-containing protein [Flavobacterium sp. 270]TDW51957.1 putative secreted protein (Por secretion system target) [Flavobacterium sp. 270]